MERTESEQRFFDLFDNAPLPMMAIDYSAMYHAIIKMAKEFDGDLETHLTKHPELMLLMATRRKILEVNKETKLMLSEIKDNAFNPKIQQQYIEQYPEQMANTLMKIASGIKQYRIQNRFQLPNGEYRDLIINFSTPTDDYSRTYLTFADITANRKLLEGLEGTVKQRTRELEEKNKILTDEIKSREKIAKDLQEIEERYRQLDAIYPVGIFHANALGRTIYVNAKAREIEGLNQKDAMNYGWLKNVHSEDKKRVLETWENAVQDGKAVNIEYRFIHDNKTVWVNGQCVPEYDKENVITGFVGILVDITKQHEAEEQLNQNQIEMAHFSRLNSMGEVASGIAHELNQPLTAINNYASGCKRRLLDLKDTIPKEIFNAIDQTIAQAQRAGDIIHHLKDFLRKGELSKSHFSLNDAIEDVLTFISRSVGQNNIKLRLKFDKTLPDIYADKIHIEQVVLNIINNAIDAILEADSTKRMITVRTERYLNDQVRITIEDTGPGIPKEMIDNIFNPFVTTKAQGMGIGLSLCYNIVDKHSGRIMVNSQANKGTIFHIILPVS